MSVRPRTLEVKPSHTENFNTRLRAEPQPHLTALYHHGLNAAGKLWGHGIQASASESSHVNEAARAPPLPISESGAPVLGSYLSYPGPSLYLCPVSLKAILRSASEGSCLSPANGP